MELLQVLIGAFGMLAAAVAGFFSWRAVGAAREAIQIEREDIEARQRERRLSLLQNLEQATLEWGETASQLHHRVLPAHVGPRSRARYQVAYQAAAIEFDLPSCAALSSEADVSKVSIRHQHALDEIRRKRNRLIPADYERL